MHMELKMGYKEAKELLQKIFGNDVLIASAHQEKALNWTVLKSDDRKGFQDYSLFVPSCCNVMTEVDMLQDKNSPTHMNTLIAKLSYKLRKV